MASIANAAPAAETPKQHPLINRSFAWIWSGSVLSTIGDGFSTVAIGLWVLTTTGSATAMSMIMLLRSIISIIVGPFAGGLADRFDRRALMLIGDLGRAIILGGIAFVMLSPSASLWVVAALLAASGILSTIFDPAIQSSVILIVGPEQIGRANSLFSLGRMSATIGGPLLGGLAAGLSGAALCMAIDAGSYLLSFLCVLLAGRLPRPERQEQGAKLGALLRDGIAYMRKERLIFAFAFVLGPLMLIGQSAFTVLFPTLMVMTWKLSGLAYGLGQSAFALGMVVGFSVLMKRADKLRAKGRTFGLGVIAGGLLMAGVGLMPWALGAFPLILVMGGVMALANICMQMAFQTQVPPEMQGRVFGVVQTAFTVATPLALALVGPLADGMGPGLTTVGAGVIFGLAGVLALLLPAVRAYR